MKEMVEINNQFDALFNKIKKIPKVNDKFTETLLKKKPSQIKLNDEVINLNESNYIIIEIV